MLHHHLSSLQLHGILCSCPNPTNSSGPLQLGKEVPPGSALTLDRTFFVLSGLVVYDKRTGRGRQQGGWGGGASSLKRKGGGEGDTGLSRPGTGQRTHVRPPSREGDFVLVELRGGEIERGEKE